MMKFSPQKRENGFRVFNFIFKFQLISKNRIKNKTWRWTSSSTHIRVSGIWLHYLAIRCWPMRMETKSPLCVGTVWKTKTFFHWPATKAVKRHNWWNWFIDWQKSLRNKPGPDAHTQSSIKDKVWVCALNLHRSVRRNIDSFVNFNFFN